MGVDEDRPAPTTLRPAATAAGCHGCWECNARLHDCAPPSVLNSGKESAEDKKHHRNWRRPDSEEDDTKDSPARRVKPIGLSVRSLHDACNARPHRQSSAGGNILLSSHLVRLWHLKRRPTRQAGPHAPRTHSLNQPSGSSAKHRSNRKGECLNDSCPL